MINVPFLSLLLFNLMILFLFAAAIKLMSFTMKVAMDSLCPKDNGYEEGDRIPLFANTIRSPEDPCYIRPYFELPFCPLRVSKHKRKKSLEEILHGDCLNETQYEFRFKKDIVGKVLCEKKLSKAEVAKFRDAINRKSAFDLFLHNIHLQHRVGEVKNVDLKTGTIYSRPKFFLYSHINFYTYHHKNKVEYMAPLSAIDSAADITEDAAINVKFTYSVLWKGLDDGQLDSHEPLKTKDWCSLDWRIIVYSFAIISFWVWLLLFAIARPYIRHYFYGSNVTSLHNGALPSPPNSSLLAAFLGIGTQLLVMICVLFILVSVGILKTCNVDLLYQYLLGIYSLTSLVSGYKATSFHSQYNQRGKKYCILHTGVLYLVPILLTVFSFTTAAKIATQSPILPQFTKVVNFVIWSICTACLLIVGSIIGQYSSKYFNSKSEESNVSVSTNVSDNTNTSTSISTNANTSTGVDTNINASTSTSASTSINANTSASANAKASTDPKASTSVDTKTSSKARSRARKRDNAKATKSINKKESRWTMLIKTPVQMFLGGLLPFLAILYHMDEIYASLWNLKVCYAFDLLFRSFVVVFFVTIVVGMTFTFCQVHLKDYKWWWSSVLRGGSTALYMFVYGIFFQARTEISGFSNLLIFLCFNACISYSFFLVLATISYYAGFHAQDIYHCKIAGIHIGKTD